ncbi:polyamine transporter [Aspergillus luchuensis]|uniref:Polyamine transporter n=1 Tax=Aspergillus kawachii TaxID=1069201 RepID=A0A146F4X0_ASPKA|nr:polyamine transporter [Aspergillus luchuensis]
MSDRDSFERETGSRKIDGFFEGNECVDGEWCDGPYQESQQ